MAPLAPDADHLAPEALAAPPAQRPLESAVGRRSIAHTPGPRRASPSPAEGRRVALSCVSAIRIGPARALGDPRVAHLLRRTRPRCEILGALPVHAGGGDRAQGPVPMPARRLQNRRRTTGSASVGARPTAARRQEAILAIAVAQDTTGSGPSVPPTWHRASRQRHDHTTLGRPRRLGTPRDIGRRLQLPWLRAARARGAGTARNTPRIATIVAAEWIYTIARTSLSGAPLRPSMSSRRKLSCAARRRSVGARPPCA